MTLQVTWQVALEALDHFCGRMQHRCRALQLTFATWAMRAILR